MIVNSLERMEKIVTRNNNLYWVGWDVADRKRSEAGRTAVNGVRVNGVCTFSAFTQLLAMDGTFRTSIRDEP